jgi:hypothetical protein
VPRADRGFIELWAAPFVWPLVYENAGQPEPGAQPISKFEVERRGGASPHIRRQSRFQSVTILFGQSWVDSETPPTALVGLNVCGGGSHEGGFGLRAVAEVSQHDQVIETCQY